jgi:hypothetical protein
MSVVVPKFGLQLKDWSSEGARRFLAAIPNTMKLEEAAKFILQSLYPAGVEAAAPSIRSITIILTSNRALKCFQAIAYQCENDLDDSHREIHIYSKWLEGLDEDSYATELLGVLRHEMVHCFQPVPHESTPHGLIEGIADWVRLRSQLGPKHWKASSRGLWSQGYDHTAFFLDYISRRFGVSAVVDLNQRAAFGVYDDDIWTELFGDTVDHLWEEYSKFLELPNK